VPPPRLLAERFAPLALLRAVVDFLRVPARDAGFFFFLARDVVLPRDVVAIINLPTVA
jgi:hypothetical protein